MRLTCTARTAGTGTAQCGMWSAECGMAGRTAGTGERQPGTGVDSGKGGNRDQGPGTRAETAKTAGTREQDGESRRRATFSRPACWARLAGSRRRPRVRKPGPGTRKATGDTEQHLAVRRGGRVLLGAAKGNNNGGNRGPGKALRISDCGVARRTAGTGNRQPEPEGERQRREPGWSTDHVHDGKAPGRPRNPLKRWQLYKTLAFFCCTWHVERVP
jgi:hypothetical protein